MTNANATTTKRNAKKRDATIVETPSHVLKSLHDEIMRDNANCTTTTKIMRTWLRVHMRDAHTHNSSWMFTTSQRHDVMMKFNAKYRATFEREQAKLNKPVRKARAKKIDAQSNDAPIVIANEANA